jgi:hypothetical protein
MRQVNGMIAMAMDGETMLSLHTNRMLAHTKRVLSAVLAEMAVLWLLKMMKILIV